jgi:hypothetical protein
MKERNIIILLGTLVLLFCVQIVSADCDAPISKDGTINIQSKTMNIKTIFVDYQGYTYLMDFDNNQQVFKNTSSSIIIKLKDIVGEKGYGGVHLLYTQDCNGDCILVDAYVTNLDTATVLIVLVIGIALGVLISILLALLL